MFSAAVANATRRRAASAPSTVLWSAFSVASKVERTLIARFSSATTRGRVRPTVSRLVWPTATIPVNRSTPNDPRLESVEDGAAERSSWLSLPLRARSTAARRELASSEIPCSSTSRTTGTTTPCGVATASPTSIRPLPASVSRKAAASDRSRRSVNVGVGSVARRAKVRQQELHRLGVNFSGDREVRDLTPRLGDFRCDQIAKSPVRRRRRFRRLLRARSRQPSSARAERVGRSSGAFRCRRLDDRLDGLVSFDRSRPGRARHRGSRCDFPFDDDVDDHRPDWHDRSRLEEMVSQRSGGGAEDVHGCLVGLDLGDHVVDLDGISGLLQPLDDERLLHRDAGSRNDDLSHQSARVSTAGRERAKPSSSSPPASTPNSSS